MGNLKKIFLGALALIVVASNITLAEAAKKNKEEQKNDQTKKDPNSRGDRRLVVNL